MIIIGVILLLLFGHRLPGMMRSLGKGVTEFKRGLKEPDDPDSSKSLAPGDDASSK
jgi:sec-independent protein translocase protein TatA